MKQLDVADYNALSWHVEEENKKTPEYMQSGFQTDWRKGKNIDFLFPAGKVKYRKTVNGKVTNVEVDSLSPEETIKKIFQLRSEKDLNYAYLFEAVKKLQIRFDKYEEKYDALSEFSEPELKRVEDIIYRLCALRYGDVYLTVKANKKALDNEDFSDPVWDELFGRPFGDIHTYLAWYTISWAPEEFTRQNIREFMKIATLDDIYELICGIKYHTLGCNLEKACELDDPNEDSDPFLATIRQLRNKR